jgi:hypothetical protein
MKAPLLLLLILTAAMDVATGFLPLISPQSKSAALSKALPVKIDGTDVDGSMPPTGDGNSKAWEDM